jgi:hypothetical protein
MVPLPDAAGPSMAMIICAPDRSRPRARPAKPVTLYRSP